MFGFIRRTRAHRDAALGALSLTPNDARALSSIDVPEGRAMSELARAWGSDPSSVTFAVGRLEKRGLVERRVPEHDRRIKRVVLTAAGRRVVAKLTALLAEPPPELTCLSPADLRALRDLCRKLEAP